MRPCDDEKMEEENTKKKIDHLKTEESDNPDDLVVVASHESELNNYYTYKYQ